MTEIKRIQLIAAAKELNHLLDADPKIRTVGIKSEDMIGPIKTAAGLLEDGDKLTTITKNILEGLGIVLPEGIIIDDDGGPPADDLSSDEAGEPAAEATVEELTALIEEMNVVMSLDPVIEIPEDADVAKLKALIKENCYDKGECQVFDNDKFSEASWKLLAGLDVNPIITEKKKPAKEKAGKEKVPAAKPAKAGKTEKPAKEKAAKPAKAPAEKKEKAFKGPGVIKSIATIIKEKGPITKENILAELVKLFPDRDKDAMKNTINVQIPNRINKEQDFQIENTDKGWKVKK